MIENLVIKLGVVEQGVVFKRGDCERIVLSTGHLYSQQQPRGDLPAVVQSNTSIVSQGNDVMTGRSRRYSDWIEMVAIMIQ